jgi:lysophospholipase L1-like esterase
MTRLILCSILISLSTAFIAPYSSAQTKKTPMKYLALGDSYTIGESVAETDRWPVQLGAALEWDKKPEIIATTGWRTDDLMNAINRASLSPPYDMVSLLIGVNNQYQGKSADAYRPEFEELLLKAIELAGGDKKKVFVVSIPDYGFTPFGKPKQEAITRDIDAFNTVNESVGKKLGVRWINITDISREGFKDPSLVAADGLHPSGKQYKLWVERIATAIRPVTR